MLFGLALDAFVLVLLATLLVGVAKAGFGGGVGVVATPLVALAMPVPEAAALMLPILIGTDVFTVGQYRRNLSRPDLVLLLPAAVVGVVVGALAFDLFTDHERALEMAVGLLALSFVGWRLLAPRLLPRIQGAVAPSPLWGAVLGAIGGFGSTLAHAGGPPITIYLLPRRLERHRFVGTIAWFFFVLNLVKLIPYGILGLLSLQRLSLALAMLPLAWLGTWLGVRLLGAIDERLFTRLVTLLLTLTGLQLLIGADLSTFAGWVL